MVRQLWTGLLVLAWATPWVACSSEESASGDAPSGAGGNGGEARDTGNPGGSDGSGGSQTGEPEIPQSKRAACRAYVTAQCQRRAECSNKPTDDCTAAGVKQCPDLMFSEGSLRTIDGLIACAAEWKTFDCTSALTGKLPSCAVPGSLPNGEECINSSQCASGACSGSGSRCGMCVPFVESGAACDDGVNACPLGEECLGYCQPRVAEILPEPMQAADGEVCVGTFSCKAGLTCASNDARTETICRPLLGENADCYYNSADPVAQDRTCGYSAENFVYCTNEGTCLPGPTEGEPCGTSSWGQKTCGLDFYCKAGTSTCARNPTLGEPCGSMHLQAGGSEVPAICSSGLACDAGTCRTERQEGESCTGKDVVCAPQTECVEGICQATDELTLLDAICAP